MGINRNNIGTSPSKKFTCGHCGEKVSSEKSFYGRDGLTGVVWYIYICHFCEKPTFFNQYGSQTPGVSFGNKVENIPENDIESIYNEARNCMSVNAFTSAIMCCRKLLMHITVSKGAEENLRFVEYINYLEDNNYITQGAKEWVDDIRTIGNEANHEIKIMSKEDAENLISFSEMLLKLIYEFPAKARKKNP